MAFASATAKIWPVTPDWTNGVSETLAWSTDYMQASATAVTQHRALLLAPRRSFTFEVLSETQERRVAEMLLAGYSGAWQLPIWPDVQWLVAALDAGVNAIPCSTAGFDFVVGGMALLYASVNRWEVVTIDSIDVDQINLTTATVDEYGPGCRLYPLRRARVQDASVETLRHHDMSRRAIGFDIDEPCDWPALDGDTYLTHQVLTERPAETDDPTVSFSRLLQSVDYGTSTPVVHDLPGIALRSPKFSWMLSGRAQHTWFRSLLYTLQGRQTPIWAPSFNRDLRPVAALGGGATGLSVEWSGYTLFGFNQANRKDVRIELDDDTVLYRRITAATDFTDSETLTLSSSLSGSSIAPERIRSISFMALATLASDSTDIEHVTDADGLATATTGFAAVVPDV